MPRILTIRLNSSLPLEIDGGRTRWRLFVAYGGKNDGHGSFIAHCLSNGNQITIFSGRARYVDGAVHRELSAATDTMLGLIYRKLVRLGLAVEIPPHERNRPF